MRAFANKKILALLALVAAAAGVSVIGASRASAAPVSINLCADTGSVTMADSTVVPTWGFVLGACTGTAGVGGPVLEVNVGDVVTINLVSNLPAGHNPSFELAGLPVKDLGGGQYEFTASRAGTFIYQSPGDAGRQEAMGLYGALVVRPLGEPAGFATSSCSAAAGSAYGSAFDRECVLVLSAIDPAFNADPDNFDMNDYLATYWLINGEAYPDTDAVPGGPANTKLLLRYVNAGFDNTSMSLLGMHERIVARDAYSLGNPLAAATETIPAGGTEDAIVSMPASAPPSPNGFPLFNRNLHLTNGTALANPGYAPGGMLTFVTP
jgi:FtsP/CotA-like multicopper oxidase with cupredoxin domain